MDTMYATTMSATRGSVKTVASAEIKPVRGQTVVARAAKSEKLAVSVASGAAAVSGLAHAEAARAGAVSDKLAAVLDAADGAADTAGALFDRAGEIIDQGSELASQTVPVIEPYAERAVKAAAPVSDAVNAYAGRAIAPLADEALKQATTTGAQAIDAADSALKAQGFDVAPVTQALTDGTQVAISKAVPILHDAADYLSDCDTSDLLQLGAEVIAAYLLLPVVFGVLGDVARGYRGDLSPIEAYDMAISKNAIIIDTRGSDVTVQLPGGANRRVIVCNVEKDGSFGANAGKLAALKVASLRGVSKGKRVILLDQNGGSAKALAKALAKQGFSQVFIVKGGYNGWSRAGLATTARGR